MTDPGKGEIGDIPAYDDALLANLFGFVGLGGAAFFVLEEAIDAVDAIDGLRDGGAGARTVLSGADVFLD